MLTIATIRGYKNFVTQLFFFVGKIGRGSMSFNNEIVFPYITIEGNNTVSFAQSGNTINVTFSKNPILKYSAFSREVLGLQISNNDVIVQIKSFPDVKFKLE